MYRISHRSARDMHFAVDRSRCGSGTGIKCSQRIPRPRWVRAPCKLQILHVKDSIQQRKIIIHLLHRRAKRITSAVVRRRTDVDFLKGHETLGGLRLQT